MTSTKFASITASLLARKGEAAPSIVAPIVSPVVAPVVAPIVAPPRPTLVPRDEPFASEPERPAEKLRRIVISMTQAELERLDIAAIKIGANRHDIVRVALSEYFRKLSAELPRRCACMEDGSAVPAMGLEM